VAPRRARVSVTIITTDEAARLPAALASARSADPSGGRVARLHEEARLARSRAVRRRREIS